MSITIVITNNSIQGILKPRSYNVFSNALENVKFKKRMNVIQKNK